MISYSDDIIISSVLLQLTYIKDVVWCTETDWNQCVKVVHFGINIENSKVVLCCILIWEDWGQCWVQEEQAIFINLQNEIMCMLSDVQ